MSVNDSEMDGVVGRNNSHLALKISWESTKCANGWHSDQKIESYSLIVDCTKGISLVDQSFENKRKLKFNRKANGKMGILEWVHLTIMAHGNLTFSTELLNETERICAKWAN